MRAMIVGYLLACIIVFCASFAPGAALRTQGTNGLRGPQRTRTNDRLLAEGIASLERGEDSIARTIFERVLAADPQSAEAHTYLGILADRNGDLSNAESHFSAAARLSPRSASAHNNYGAILLRLNRRKEATAEFAASLKLNPNQANALVNLAQIRFEANTPEDIRVAYELFRRADAIAPDARIARALTIIALRVNEQAQAANYYREFVKRLPAELNTTSNAGERSELGAALLEGGLLTEAEAELKEALALDSTNPETVVRLARVYLARKDMAAAGRTLEAAIARKVEAAPIYSLLSVVYQKSGHPENAIPAMRLAIQLDPQSEKYRFQYGILLTDTYAPAAAVIRLNEALQSFPKSARLWLALGLANLKMNKNNEAAEAFDHAIKLDPTFAQAYAYLGITRVAMGLYEDGIRFYDQALNKEPKLGVVHYLRADAMLKQNDPNLTLVETHLKQAIKLDATYAPAQLALGKLHSRMGRLEEAAAELQRVTSLDPDLAETYYQLGRTYARLKRPDEAKVALATFKRLSESQKVQQQDELRDIVRRLADVLF